MQTERCSVENCTNEMRYKAQKLCSMHRRRLQRHGDLQTVLRKFERNPLRSHPLRKTWKQMIRRCYTENYVGYKNHGGRGIQVDERWLGPEGLQNFILDMGPKPDGTSIERIDNDGNYSPENCRWATRIEQRFNQRDVHLSIKDIRAIRDSKDLAEDLAIRYHVNRKTIGRIKRNRSWSDNNLAILDRSPRE